MKKYRILALLLAIMTVIMVVPACTSATPTPTASPTQTAKPTATATTAPTATTTTAPTTTVAPTATAATKTLKIGMISWLGWPLGLDMLHGIQVLVDQDNAAGGVKIGADKYMIQLISYDDNNAQATAVSAANRLVFEDKVSFIIGDPLYENAYLPITDPNKVIVVGYPSDQAILSPNYKYAFQGGFMNCSTVVLAAWMTSRHPEFKTYIAAAPDNMQGHTSTDNNTKIYATFGINLQTMFYPASASDLSALGTKIKSLNPDVFMPIGGGPVSDALALKAVYEAGYKGQMFGGTTQPAGTLATIVPIPGLEGMICAAWPVEFDRL
jgi:branched-chain amino acid transport system substrate-binding protein